jgi:hypothetical protein
MPSNHEALNSNTMMQKKKKKKIKSTAKYSGGGWED